MPRISKKNFENDYLAHTLFLATRQTTTIRNAFANNMSTDIKLSEAQISKIIQSGGSLGSWLGNLEKKALTNITILLARDNLPGLRSSLTANTINRFERKVGGKGAVRVGKRLTLLILNEDVNDIIEIIKSLEDSGAVAEITDGVAEITDGVTKIVKDTIKMMADFLQLC